MAVELIVEGDDGRCCCCCCCCCQIYQDAAEITGPLRCTFQRTNSIELGARWKGCDDVSSRAIKGLSDNFPTCSHGVMKLKFGNMFFKGIFFAKMCKKAARCNSFQVVWSQNFPRETASQLAHRWMSIEVSKEKQQLRVICDRHCNRHNVLEGILERVWCYASVEGTYVGSFLACPSLPS